MILCRISRQMELVELYGASNRPYDAAEVALNMVDKMPDNGWSLDTLPFQQQNMLGTILSDSFLYSSDAIRIFNNLILHMKKHVAANNEWQMNQTIPLMNRGLLFARDPNYIAESLADFQTAIDIFKDLHNEMGEQFLPTWQNNLAEAHMNRGNTLADDPYNASEALREYQASLDIRQQLRIKMGKNFPPAWQNNLSQTLMNRGNEYQRQNFISESMTDYQTAIDLWQQLQSKVDEQLPPTWLNDLALAFMNRGNLYQKQNLTSESMLDYEAAINIQQLLYSTMGDQFPLNWKCHIALTLMNRGNLHHQQSQTSEALGNYKVAIDIWQELIHTMGKSFPSKWWSFLAVIHRIRGNLFSNIHNHTSEAFGDFQTAINILQQLHAQEGKQFLPVWQNDLAQTYMNRGNLYERQNDVFESITDYKKAIDIWQELGHNMGESFPPEWKSYLAGVHMKRGVVFSNIPNHTAESVADYNAAIDIWLELRQNRGKSLSPEWESYLAVGYMERGSVFLNIPNHATESLADYNAAIDIWQQLLHHEKHLETSCAWQCDLAKSHLNRGILHSEAFNQVTEALEDYQAAIDILQQLRNEIGENFPPTWKNELAMCCYNFALFLESSDKEKACSLFSEAFQLVTSLHDEFGDDMPILWMQVLTASEEACKRCGV